jgi:hypothetical protein
MDNMIPRHKDLVVVRLVDVRGISVGVAREWRGVAVGGLVPITDEVWGGLGDAVTGRAAEAVKQEKAGKEFVPDRL